MQEGYTPAYSRLPEADRQVIYQALALLKALIFQQVLDGPKPVMDYLTLMYADLEHEILGVLWLNNQRQLVAQDVLFRGTLTQTAVHPREIVKQGLSYNAAGAVLFHNHPSGCSEPSQADELLTRALKQTLGLVDIRLLDHIVVSAGGATSFAERALL